MFHPKGPTLRELIKQGLSSTREGYDQLAPKFDYTPFATSKEIINAVMKQLLKENGGNKFNSAIDLCTGTGAGMLGLHEIVRELVFGVDSSKGMLAEATAKSFESFPYKEKPYFGFKCVDIFQFRPESNFDLATCFGALGHIPKEKNQRFVNLVYSWLNPGGIFAFITGEHPKWYDPRGWPYYAFDTVMRIRNRWIKPEFVMYYINFLLPDVLELFHPLEWEKVEVIPILLNGRKTGMRLVVAKKLDSREPYSDMY